MNDYETPLALCWHCDRALTGAATIDGSDYEPAEGGLSFCLYCGTISVFDADIILRPPTVELLEELRQDAQFRQAFTYFQWSRQRLLLEHKLLGVDEEKKGKE